MGKKLINLKVGGLKPWTKIQWIGNAFYIKNLKPITQDHEDLSIWV